MWGRIKGDCGVDLGNKLQSEKEKEELKNVEGRKVTE